MDPSLFNFGGAVGLGAVLTFLCNIGLFARKEEISGLRAEMAMFYVLKADLEKKLDAIDDQLKLMNEKLDKLNSH